MSVTNIKQEDLFPYVLEAYNDGVMTGTYHNPATGEREFSPKSPLTMAEWRRAPMVYILGESLLAWRLRGNKIFVFPKN